MQSEPLAAIKVEPALRTNRGGTASCAGANSLKKESSSSGGGVGIMTSFASVTVRAGGGRWEMGGESVGRGVGVSDTKL